MLEVIETGEKMIQEGHFGAPHIQTRIDDINAVMDHLQELAALRKKRLLEAVDFHQFFADADDVDLWMLDTLRVVTSPDIGRDEATVQSLLKKHHDVMENLAQHDNAIETLHSQVDGLGDVVSANSPTDHFLP